MEEWRRVQGDRRYQGMMPHVYSPIGDQYEVRRVGQDIVLTIEPGMKVRQAAQNDIYAKKPRLAPILNLIRSIEGSLGQNRDPGDEAKLEEQLDDAKRQRDTLMGEIEELESITSQPKQTVEIRVSVSDISAMRFEV